MSTPPKQHVRIDHDVVRFNGRLSAHDHIHFLGFVHKVRRFAMSSVRLDFAECAYAFPEFAVPALVDVSLLRRDGVKVDVVLPADTQTELHFRHSNFAHFLDPSRYPRNDHRHLFNVPIRRFTTAEEQYAACDEAVDVVLKSLEIKSRSSLAGLEWCLSEITDNVSTHAGSDIGGFLQLESHKSSSRIACCIADGGRGILASLREGYPGLRDDMEAISAAVKPRVTRNSSVGQGNGLYGSLAIAHAAAGSFAVTSGQSSVFWHAKGCIPNLHPNERKFTGTAVAVQFSFDRPVDLTSIFEGDDQSKSAPFVDVVEDKYLSDDARRLTLVVREETAGFGSRLAGSALRMKARNLMNAEPACPLVVDWATIPLVSSSFADEFVAKLFVELGPTEFSSRVKLIRMEEIVRHLIDRAIVQRMSAPT